MKILGVIVGCLVLLVVAAFVFGVPLPGLVGRRYTIRGFDQYGHIELRPTRMDTVWIESDLVTLVRRRNSA